MNMKIKKPIIVILITLLSLLLASLSCSRYPYRTFVRQKGEPRFSFEYPRYYEGIGPREVTEPTSVTLFRFKGKDIIYYLKINIYLFTPDAQTVLGKYMAIYEDNTNFKIIERISIIVDSKEQNMLVFSYLYESYDLPKGSEIYIQRVVVFDHEGWVFEFIGESSAKYESVIKSDFEHILQTFKILE